MRAQADNWATEDTYLPVGQAAEALHVSASTVRNWAAKGYLKAVSLPSGVRRIPQKEIERLLGEMFAMPTSVEESDYSRAERPVEANYGFEDPERYI